MVQKNSKLRIRSFIRESGRKKLSEDIGRMMQKVKKESKKWDGGCLWSGVGVIFGGLALGLFFLLSSLTRNPVSKAGSEPELTIIVSPTSTLTQMTSASEEASQDPTPTGSQETDAGSDLNLGDIVEIFGTGGQGLSLRNEPGLSTVVGSYGLDGEVFEIKGGPLDVDGFVWWYLVNPYDNSKQGWGVGAYLRAVAP
jgi:hypothetical protein